jgi:hypothetical protein
VFLLKHDIILWYKKKEKLLYNFDFQSVLIFCKTTQGLAKTLLPSSYIPGWNEEMKTWTQFCLIGGIRAFHAKDNTVKTIPSLSARKCAYKWRKEREGCERIFGQGAFPLEVNDMILDQGGCKPSAKQAKQKFQLHWFHK